MTINQRVAIVELCTVIERQMTMNTIRIFTAGTHNGIQFSNEDIQTIAQKTADFGEEMIPFVLGHPDKNLPIMGFLPKAAIKIYQEGDKTSIGFDKDTADMSEQSMEILRGMGHNKLSPRLVEGVIKHIGLVEKAAVAENNAQDFADLTGTFAARDNLFETTSKGFSTLFKNPFKKNKNDMAEESKATVQPDMLEQMQNKVDKLTESVTKLTELAEANAKKESDAAAKAAEEAIKADFASAEYSHLTDIQRQDFAAMCVQLPADQQTKFKESIKAMAKRPQAPGNGSVTAEFGSKSQEKSADEILRQQYASFGK